MIKTITEFEFIDGFKNRPDNFSYDGLKALFEWHENLEWSDGQPIEFDRVAIACDFNEYESLAEFNKDYDKDFVSINDVVEETTVIPIFYDGCSILYKGFIIQTY